jgi:TRAP-type uncharacterized transport system fused permease subunit
VALIVPFLFVLEPSLLLMGEPSKVALAIITATCGCYFIGAGLTGYFLRPMPLIGRLMALFGGGFLLIPAGIGLNLGWITDILGVLLIAGSTGWQIRQKQKFSLKLKVNDNG